MYIVALIFILILILYIRGVFIEKRKRLNLLESLKNDYGKYKKKEYKNGRNHRNAIFKRKSDFRRLDDITANDIDFLSVYERIDACKSSLGEEYLYYQLRDQDFVRNNPEFESVIEAFDNDDELRTKLLFSLSRIGYIKNHSPFEYIDYLNGLERKSFVRDIIFDLLYIPFIALTIYRPVYGAALIFVLTIINIFLYFREKKEIEGLLSCTGFLVKLASEGLLLEGEDIGALSFKKGFLQDISLLLKKLKANGAYIALSDKGGEGSISSSSPLTLVLNYINMIFHIDIICYRSLLGIIHGNGKQIEDLMYLFGYIDSAISVGSFRKSMKDNVCIPEFTDDGKAALKLVDGIHPLVKDAVPNSIETSRGILLTGSNASGKSTFLRMVAINALLAQTINTVCGAQYIAPMFDIYSSIALKDNLSQNESYFIVEIKSLKRIIDAADSSLPVLCFVDEVLRGTNTSERIAASTVLLGSFATKNVLCFAATHDMELADNLSDVYTNMHFSEIVDETDVKFEYKLLPGKTNTRNALALLRAYGYENKLIESAEKLANQLDIKRN